MQLTKILLQTCILMGVINLAVAKPPFQVLQSCINTKAYNDQVTIDELGTAGPVNKSLAGCENQYDRIFQGSSFGTLTCQNKFFLIINDKKIDPKTAENMSINPLIKAGEAFTKRALWYKFDYLDQSYLCILAPLAEQGIGSAHNQYYLIENAFDKHLTPKLYFYFLDKDIAPSDNQHYLPQ